MNDVDTPEQIAAAAALTEWMPERGGDRLDEISPVSPRESEVGSRATVPLFRVRIPNELLDDLDALMARADVHGRLRANVHRLRQHPDDPELCIGVVKDLLESTIATIVERETGMAPAANVPLPRKAKRLLEILPCVQAGPHHEQRSAIMLGITRAVGNLVQQLATLRNLRGVGHGHAASIPREHMHHAELAVTTGLSVTRWIWHVYAMAPNVA